MARQSERNRARYLIPADDTSFNRLVLKSPVPTIALFCANWCEECDDCIQRFARLAQTYEGHIRVVLLDIDQSPLVVSSFGAQQIPSYLLFCAGEPLLYSAGYLPTPILEQFFQVALTLEQPVRGVWLPTERDIEDRWILPILARWEWVGERQVECKVQGPVRRRRGVVDILVRRDPLGEAITLFENKRQIADIIQLQSAVDQAFGYARALSLPSFVVADLRQMWVYQVQQEEPLLAQLFSTATLEQDPTPLRELLLALVHG